MDFNNRIILCYGRGTKVTDTVILPLSYSKNYVICGGSIYKSPTADYTEAFYSLTLSGFSYRADPNGHWDAIEINWITLGF